jgi:hypothetical protein
MQYIEFILCSFRVEVSTYTPNISGLFSYTYSIPYTVLYTVYRYTLYYYYILNYSINKICVIKVSLKLMAHNFLVKDECSNIVYILYQTECGRRKTERLQVGLKYLSVEKNKQKSSSIFSVMQTSFI